MKTTLAALAAFPHQLKAFYAAVPDAFKHWTPDSWEGIPSEHFSAIEQVCHVRDIEIEGYHVRFRRALHEEHPLLPDIESEALAIERDYVHANAVEIFDSFRLARLQTIELIEALTPAQWQRTAKFDGRETSVRGLVHLLCSHDQQHLAGMQWLLSRIDRAAPLQHNA